MRVVHGHHGAVASRQGDDVGQLGDVAFHREHAIGEDELQARVFGRPQLVLQVRHVGMPVHRRLTLRDGLGQADRVDDGRVIQLVGDDDVLLAEQRGDEAFVRVPAAHVAEGRLAPHEPCERLFELAVNGEGAADEAHGAGSGPELVQGALAAGDHLRLVAESQIVVGRENHDLAAPFHPGACGLRPFEVVEALVDALLLELLELGFEPGGEAHAISRMILPASPERMAARASSILASGNWCVITGRGSTSPAER